jgi:hypothetical protein
LGGGPLLTVLGVLSKITNTTTTTQLPNQIAVPVSIAAVCVLDPLVLTALTVPAKEKKRESTARLGGQDWLKCLRDAKWSSAWKPWTSIRTPASAGTGGTANDRPWPAHASNEKRKRSGYCQ